MSIKLHLGCGIKKLPNWINIDKYNDHADVKADIVSLSGYNNVDEIYTSHTVEHLLPQEFKEALLKWYHILKPGGTLTIRCPNALFWIQKWLDATDEQRYSNPDILVGILGSVTRGPEYYHHNLFTLDILKRYLTEAAFTILECREVTARTPQLDRRLASGELDEGEIVEGKTKSDIWCKAVKNG